MKVVITECADGSFSVDFPNGSKDTQNLETQGDGCFDAGDLATILISCGITVHCDMLKR